MKGYRITKDMVETLIDKRFIRLYDLKYSIRGDGSVIDKAVLISQSENRPLIDISVTVL